MKKTNEKKNIIRLPITKLQKLKNKHRYLILIIAILILILTSIYIFNKTDKKEEINKPIPEEIPKKEEDKTLAVYDINSKERPYAVMIPNDGSAKKRQYGLSKAYLIYEITVEGGITRLMALFKDVEVDKIGPVRSSRHYYLDYALESDAIYVHFGWSPQAQSDISTLNINNLNGIYNPYNMFWRDKNYSSPNNAFTSTDNIKNAATNKKYNLESTNYELLNYKKEIDFSKDASLKTAKTVKVNYSNNTYVKYTYDEANEYYLRYNNEKKHIDNGTNEQIHTKNIIVLKMDTINISGDDKGRQNLNNIGSGEGFYITEGKSIKINWTKDDRTKKTIYKDSNGNILNVNDGNTFIQIQPTDKNLTIE